MPQMYESFGYLPAPKGCDVIAASTKPSLRQRLFPPAVEYNRKAWEKYWLPREQQARLCLSAIADMALRYEFEPEIRDQLYTIDSETGEPLNILLAKACGEFRANKYVTLPGNRLHDLKQGADAAMALGGEFNIDLKIGQETTGYRTANISMIGLILNEEHNAIEKLVKGKEVGLNTNDIIYIINAFIKAHLAYRDCSEEGTLADHMTQSEVDLALEWVNFNC